MNGLTRYIIGATEYYEAVSVDQELACYRDDAKRSFEINEALRKANMQLWIETPIMGHFDWVDAASWKKRAQTAESKLLKIVESASKWLE